MDFSGIRKLILATLLSILAIVTIGLGISLGFAVAMTKNIQNIEDLQSIKPSIPSKILDRNGELITELFREQKRDLVNISELPKSIIHSLLSREDKLFFKHNGFSLHGFSRASFKILIDKYEGGGSTLTQQLAKIRYTESEHSITRKIKELWWAWQLERRFSKYEILEQYLNIVPFGHGVHGIEAASRFFNKHPAKDNTIAENVMLVIQLVRPNKYSPIRRPEEAKIIQRIVLDSVVENGFISQEDADSSFDLYWENFDWTRDNVTTVYLDREDKAPWFSEHIRGELDNLLYGKQNMYEDGYTIHSTLDLNYQMMADKYVAEGLKQWNKTYSTNLEKKINFTQANFIPVIDMLSLAFNIDDIRITESLEKRKAVDYVEKEIIPSLELYSLLFNMDDAKSLTSNVFKKSRDERSTTSIETALVTLENETGYILALIGGSQYESDNQYNRALQGTLQPGSSFKPIFYSAAVSSGVFTPASKIVDKPTTFENPDGSIYAPENYRGRWKGDVTLRYALATSMNIPSIKVLEKVGFDATIERAARLYGISDPVEIKKTFPRFYTLALGVISITPLQSARAFSTFANQGRSVEPLAIRFIKDRNGNIILNPEKDLRLTQKENSERNQILTPAAAYIMTNLLESSVKFSNGTLGYARRSVGGFDGMPMAGKTGTTQNWSDAWTVGFSPYYTTALWTGFDFKKTLGHELTGAGATGPYWAKYMKAIHKGLPIKEFYRPETGIIEMEVDSISGLLPTEDSKDTKIEIFLTGTEPTTFDSYQTTIKDNDAVYANKWEDLMYIIDINDTITNDFDDLLEIDSGDIFDIDNIDDEDINTDYYD